MFWIDNYPEEQGMRTVALCVAVPKVLMIDNYPEEQGMRTPTYYFLLEK